MILMNQYLSKKYFLNVDTPYLLIILDFQVSEITRLWSHTISITLPLHVWQEPTYSSLHALLSTADGRWHHSMSYLQEDNKPIFSVSQSDVRCFQDRGGGEDFVFWLCRPMLNIFSTLQVEVDKFPEFESCRWGK